MSPRVERNRRRLYTVALLLGLAGLLILELLTLQGGGLPDGVYLVAFAACILAAAGYGDASRARRRRRIQYLHALLEERAERQDPEGFRRWQEGHRGR